MTLNVERQEERGFWPWLVVGLVGQPDPDGTFLPALERGGYALPAPPEKLARFEARLRDELAKQDAAIDAFRGVDR